MHTWYNLKLNVQNKNINYVNKEVITILTKDVIEQRKQEYIKNIQIKYNELGRIPRVSDVENDDRFNNIHSYLNSHKWNDLIYEALGISNGKGRQTHKHKYQNKYENKENDFLLLLKEELNILQDDTKKYINQTYFDENRNRDLPCSETYKKMLNKSWKEIIEDLGF